MARIPCYVLAFHDAPTVRASLDWLVGFRDRLELVVVENPSERTDGEIRPYVESLLAAGAVDRYLLMDENISNNAFEVALDHERARWEGAEHVLLTDGDLVGDAGWLDEELAILTRAEVFACGIRLSMENLHVEGFPEAVGWVPPPRAEHDDDWIEGLTGLHLVMLGADGLAAYSRFRAANRLRFLDSTMHHFCYRVLDLRWARTKATAARHLTWDLYADPEHPYTRFKTGKSLREHWQHERYCGLREISAAGERYVPTPV